MKITETEFEGLVIIEPDLFADARGHFFESHNKQTLQKAGIDIEFVQDNQSLSRKGVIRGLHFQKSPHAQNKLVRVLSGTILDVVVDLRSKQKTFGKYYALTLSAESNRQLLVPKGFAHGFLVTSERAEVLYKCDEYYQPGSEGGVRYNDPELAIDWKWNNNPVLSSKDLALPLFSEIGIQF